MIVAQCSAKSKRSQERCLRWAVRGRGTCHMHGGRSGGSRTKLGKERSRLAVLKHGLYTKKSKTERHEILDLIKKSKNFLSFL